MADRAGSVQGNGRPATLDGAPAVSPTTAPQSTAPEPPVEVGLAVEVVAAPADPAQVSEIEIDVLPAPIEAIVEVVAAKLGPERSSDGAPGGVRGWLPALPGLAFLPMVGVIAPVLVSEVPILLGGTLLLLGGVLVLYRRSA